ncbi:MAG: hypothetical protein OEV74_07665 [Cyclobacteriaceae bacterium]|nr:hypothetical protein [Cyclobacteriaceae bacterium]MDH4296136.1 hypothetical protein [Cyclobacteriaceae bacterium]MDH5248337.1 hypothetical protein [Cyclobacteriaceae bacterium]
MIRNRHEKSDFRFVPNHRLTNGRPGKHRFPHVMVIMLGFILFSGLTAYIFPQREHKRVSRPGTYPITVVPGSFELLAEKRMSVFQIFMSIPTGIIERADQRCPVYMMRLSYSLIVFEKVSGES